MRKILILLLCSCIVLGMIGCGNKQSNSNDEVTNSVPTTPNNENLVYEDDDVKIVLEKWEFQETDKLLYLTMTATNKTNIDITLGSDNETVNSWVMLDLNAYKIIPANSASEFVLTGLEGCFDGKGINTFADIKELTFELSIRKGDEFTDIKNVLITLHPHEDKDYDFVGHKIGDTDTVLVDYTTENGTFKIVYTGNHVYHNDVVYLEYYCINTFDHNMVIEFDQIKIGEKQYSANPNLNVMLGGKELVDICSIWAEADVIAANNQISFIVKILNSKTSKYVVETDVIMLNLNKE